MPSSEESLREERGLTPVAFGRLLEWLDDGVESHGDTYLEIRRRLVAYFERRNRRASDELADETLNRIAHTLETAGAIAVTPPARYCYVVARYVLLEDFRRDRSQVSIDERRPGGESPADRLPQPLPDETEISRQERLSQLDCCLAALPAEQRELVIEYYKDSGRTRIERRRELARRLGISMNALGIRACRIRDAIEACVERNRNKPR